MRNAHFICAAIVLVPGVALAASAFDGTWKVNLNHIQLSKTPDVYVISADSYTCSSCTPPYTVKADGTDRPVSGHDWDTVAVTVTPNSVTTVFKLKGKLLATSKASLAADAKTVQTDSTSYNGAEPIVSKVTSRRVTPGAAGSNALSGSWQTTKVESFSDSGAVETLAMSDEGFSYSGNGQSYEAKFDGKKYPIKGDVTNTMVELKKVSASEVIETDFDKGKVVDIVRMTVAADGKSLHVVDTQPQTKRETHFSLDKQ